MRALLLLSLVGPMPIREIEPVEGIDPEQVERGIELRLGPAAEGWAIDLRPAGARDVLVQLRTPSGEVLERTIALTSEGEEERSRELAAALVTLVELRTQSEPTPVPAEAPTPPEPVATPTAPRARADAAWRRGWLGARAEVTSGSRAPRAAAGGVGLSFGVWGPRQIVAPQVELGWLSGGGHGLSVHAVRLGAGVALGSPLARDRLWLGGVGIVRAQWLYVRAQGRASGWASSSVLAATARVRGPRWFFEVRVGVELTAPSLRFAADEGELRWGTARWLASVGAGWRWGRDGRF